MQSDAGFIVKYVENETEKSTCTVFLVLSVRKWNGFKSDLVYVIRFSETFQGYIVLRCA